MRERRDLIALLALMLSLAMISVLVRPRAAAQNERDPRVSTFRVSPGGAGALYLLLDELDIEADRQLMPWLTADSTTRALVVLSPVEQPTPREISALLRWVNDGGTLIFAGASDLLADSLDLFSHYPMPDTLGPIEMQRWAGVPAFPTRHALAGGTDSINAFSTVFRHPLPRGADVIMQTRENPAVITFPLGSGRVHAWADATPLTNAQLQHGSAGLLFTRMAADGSADGGVVRFDEYHHGYRPVSMLRSLRNFMTDTSFGRALLQATLACIVLLLLLGRRFGAPLAETAGRRRSPLEHVEAVAGAYSRARARHTTRRLLMNGLERQLGRRVLVNDDQLAPTALGNRSSAEQLKEEWARGDDGDLVALAGAIDNYVREVRQWK